MKQPLLIFILFLLFQNSYSQTGGNGERKTKPLIQLSGVIVDGDSLVGVPFVSILIKGKNRGVISDIYGFFTMVVEAGDELQFLSINHKSATRQLEDTLKLKHYFIIQNLLKDTIQLGPVSVYPWPSKEEFKQAFLNLDLSETDYERAAKNLDKAQLTYGERNLRMDAQANYNYAMQQYIAKVHSGGQAPVNNLLNPMAWAKFIDALSKGKFKRQDKKK